MPKLPIVTALHKTDEKLLGILQILHSVIMPCKYSLLIVVRKQHQNLHI